MAKEFMKIGPITCTIIADASLSEERNKEMDFTMATEKPMLKSHVSCSDMNNGGMVCQTNSPNIMIKTNVIGARILKLCKGKMAIEKIAVELSEEYDFADEEFVEQVKTFLNIFKTYKLI
ncbi:MAG: PqqD family protein [Candidatus Zhuqueibacterota bacterium]